MTKFIPLIVLTLFITSCASTNIDNINSDNTRIIASNVIVSNENCKFLVTSIINNNQIENSVANTLAETNIDNSDIDPSFTKLLLKRSFLKEKYSKVIESIRDFNPTADLAIYGKAKLLVNPKEAYLSKIMMIRRARYTLDISYYIFTDDEAGRELLHEVRLAIKRGVKVRIMLDSLGSMGNAPFHSEIKSLSVLRGGFIRDLSGKVTTDRAKAEIVIINPMFNIRAQVSNWYLRVRNLFAPESEKIPLTTFSMNRRSHDKILMIDAFSPENSMAIIGGRNIANYYYALDPDGKTTFQDLEILIRNIAKEGPNGDVHNALEDYYNKIFYYAANKNLENFLIGINRAGVKKQFENMRDGSQKLLSAKGLDLEKLLKKMTDENFLDQDLEEGMISIVHELQNFSRLKAFLKPMGEHNPSNGNSLVGRLHSAMKEAKSSIEIVSPYLWLSEEDINFFKKWLSEDPKRTLKIISNSISTTDNIPAQAMVDTILGPKLVTELEGTPIAKQVKVYAYGKLDDAALGGTIPYGKLHAKFAIMDDSKVLVGTSNLDPRSRYLNSELGVFFVGPENGQTALQLKTYFNELAQKSYEWGSKDWNKLREHPENRISLGLQSFVGKILHFFNLVPLI